MVTYIEDFKVKTKQHIVLEHAPGMSLLKYLNMMKRISEPECKTIFKNLLKGVDYLHTHKIAHRDLKLENIIIDKHKNVKIIDFGFASDTNKDFKGHMFCGTPSYMSPEIINHQKHSYFKADIWALGIILYALLSGKFPFKAQNDKDLYSKIRKGVFNLPEGITIEAKSMILNMLQIDPNFRKGTQNLLRDIWVDEDGQTAKELSPVHNKRVIMGTIEKYQKLYNGNRRNIIQESNMSSEQKKSKISTSPYNPKHISYNNSTLDSIKNSGKFIPAYFKGAQVQSSQNNQNLDDKKLVVPEHKELKQSAQIEFVDQDGLNRLSIKRNSKSNIHLKSDKIRDFNVLAGDATHKIITKGNRYVPDKHKFTKKDVEKFVGNFQNMRENNNKSVEPRGSRFNSTYRRSYHSPSTKLKPGWIGMEKKKSLNSEVKPKTSMLKVKKYDPTIIDVIQKLGYGSQNILIGLSNGNQNITAMYNKLKDMRNEG